MSQVHDGVASGPWSGRFGRARAAGALLLALAASPWVAEPARAQSSAAEVQRISDPRILAYGRKVFRRNCAVCHGWNAEGTVAD